MTNEEEPTQEERLLAALAHASVIANGMGAALGVLIYLTRKEKTAYAAGQALQAAVYQVVGMAIVALAWIIWTFFYFLSLIPVVGSESSGDGPPALFWIGLGSMICPALITAAWLGYGFYGAIRAWSGADFRYAYVGKLVAMLDEDWGGGK